MYTMTDRGTSPTFSLSPQRVADVFYEMHTLCENELELSMQQKNLISLGYLLYANPDNILLIGALEWTNPEMLLEVHQLMLKVCEQAHAVLKRKKLRPSIQTQNEYSAVRQLIEQKSQLFAPAWA